MFLKECLLEKLLEFRVEFNKNKLRDEFLSSTKLNLSSLFLVLKFFLFKLMISEIIFAFCLDFALILNNFSVLFKFFFNCIVELLFLDNDL